MENEIFWEQIHGDTFRAKVDGGHLYHVLDKDGNCMSFVPDIDLTRYQAHLRDAYKQGYEAGHADGKVGIYAGPNEA